MEPISENKTETQTTAPPQTPKEIDVTKGLLTPKSSSELLRTIEQLAKGVGFPKWFDTPQKRLAAYSFARALKGDQWQLCLRNLAIIQEQIVMFGELPAALAEDTKQVAEKEIFSVDENLDRICLHNKNIDKPAFAGVCIIQRIGRSKKEFTYTINEARKAGQYPPMKAEYVDNRRTGKMIENTESPWMKQTKLMLERKAMNLAVKFEFPDAIIGAAIAEHDFDQAPDLQDERDVSMQESHKSLNDLFADKPEV